jgi:hypothetical protein
MEGDIKARKRDRSVTTLKDNIALSLLFFNRAIIAVIHDVLQHLLDLCETKFLGQLGLTISTNISQQSSNTYLGNVNLLHLEIIKNIRES